MNQKESKVLRDQVVKIASESVGVEGFEFIGFTSEGANFRNANGDTYAVRCVVKKPETDVDEMIRQFEEKMAKQEKEKKEKEAKGE